MPAAKSRAKKADSFHTQRRAISLRPRYSLLAAKSAREVNLLFASLRRGGNPRIVPRILPILKRALIHDDIVLCSHKIAQRLR
jgi:hypothetical protein